MTAMNSDEDKLALIDLDGTVADYDTAMRVNMRALQGPDEIPYGHRYPESAEPPHIEARRKLIQRQPGFWRNLVPLPLGFEVVREMQRLNFNLHVLSKGPKKCPNAWSEKMLWCEEHLPDALVTVGMDKGIVFGRVLFDDFPPYFEAWLKWRPRGLVISLAHPWNVEYAKGGVKEHPNVFRYDGSEGRELIARLTRAYERGPREAL
jgi:5'(3')-deoxyribonucleotidase